MRFIGITGGVGAGKSEILAYLKKRKDTRVLLADEIAHDLMLPGSECYERICTRFPDESLRDEKGMFQKEQLAKVIFQDAANREAMNEIVHPAVKEYVKEVFGEEQRKGQLKYLFLEAALLIEEQYDKICDELWYIYTSEENRRIRLKESRGYSDAKIDAIFASQLTEEEFKKACKVVIDNNGSREELYKQIEEGLKNG